MFEMNEIEFAGPAAWDVLVEDDELMQVTDEYIHSFGYLSLRDIDTPAFMRQRYDVAVHLEKPEPISPEVPDPISNLLDHLFNSAEKGFSFQSA